METGGHGDAAGAFFWCAFFGDGTVDWIPRSNIKKFCATYGKTIFGVSQVLYFIGQKEAFEAAKIALASQYKRDKRIVAIEPAPWLKLGVSGYGES